MTRQHDNGLYRVLGLTRGATPTEISRAYRSLLRQLHPDANPLPDHDDVPHPPDGATGSGEREPATRELLRQVLDAYSVLGDPARRARHDARLDAGLDGSRPALGDPAGSTAVPITVRVHVPGRAGPPIRALPPRWHP